MPVNRFRIPVVSTEHGFGPICCEIVNLQGGVVASSHVSFVVGGEREVTDGMIVGLNMPDIVEVGLPKLHNAVMVRGNEPFFAMGIHCSSDGTVMCLYWISKRRRGS